MKIIGIFFISYLAILLILYFLQERLIFFPDSRVCDGLKSLNFEGENIRFIEKKHPQAKVTLIHFHGNAGGACDRDFVIDALKNTPVNIILAEYPGYSGDTPFPNLLRIKKNAEILFKYFKKSGEPIFLYGESLGTVISTYLASKGSVDGLLLQSPFPSLGIVGQSAYPIFPVKWLIKDDFKPQNISTKTIIFIAEDDEIIPKKISESQINFLENVKVFTFPNRTHNDLVINNKKLWSEAISFLTRQ